VLESVELEDGSDGLAGPPGWLDGLPAPTVVVRPDDDILRVEAWDGPVGASTDVVFFSFWLSHVPRQRLEEFWSLVARCLAPNGRAFLLDNRRTTAEGGDPYVAEYREDLHIRRLDDGTEHRVVEIYYEPDQLTDTLRQIG
jgi:hypothetical protein